MKGLVTEKPRIQNVMYTASPEQKVGITKQAAMPYGIYDEAVYCWMCDYATTPEMDGRITLFPSGKMIFCRGRSIENTTHLNHTKFYLVQNKIIGDIDNPLAGHE